MANAQQIIAEINAHMQKYLNTKNSGWYVGIAADPRQRLFTDHQVKEKGDVWIYKQADSHSIAREVEKAYHDSGHKGGPGGGDHTTVYVYAYVITISTVE